MAKKKWLMLLTMTSALLLLVACATTSVPANAENPSSKVEDPSTKPDDPTTEDPTTEDPTTEDPTATEDPATAPSGGESGGSSGSQGGSSGSQGGSSGGSSGGASGGSSEPAIVPTPGSYSGGIDTYQPHLSGSVVYNDGVSQLDASNTSRGYVMFYTGYGGGNRLKLQVAASSTYNYDVYPGQWYTIPLQMGSGSYVIRLMEQNPDSGKYHAIFNQDKQAISVSLASSLYPYLYPNILVSYTNGSAAVRKSFDLCANATSEAQKVAAIYDYVTKHISYDYGKAASVSSGYIPNPDSTLASGSGICFDYASLVAAMLRAQDIPTQLSVGTRNGADHAWNYIYIDGTGWIAVGISFSGGTWNFTDATFGVAGSGASGGYAETRTY